MDTVQTTEAWRLRWVDRTTFKHDDHPHYVKTNTQDYGLIYHQGSWKIEWNTYEI